MKRGDVYWADLVPRSGSEQQGRRHVIVISHDAFNQTQGWRSIIVVPLSTSVAQAGRGPSAVLLSPGAAGLSKDSVALCHQVTTLDRTKLTQRIGELNSMELRQVEDGLKAALRPSNDGSARCGFFHVRLAYFGLATRNSTHTYDWSTDWCCHTLKVRLKLHHSRHLRWITSKRI